jgi:uroporphyrinogen-III synthase
MTVMECGRGDLHRLVARLLLEDEQHVLVIHGEEIDVQDVLTQLRRNLKDTKIFVHDMRTYEKTMIRPPNIFEESALAIVTRQEVKWPVCPCPLQLLSGGMGCYTAGG